MPEDWPLWWLEGTSCRPPCWEGITPGQTTAGEAVEILQNSPLIATTEIVTDTLIPNRGVLKWQWVDGTKGGEAVFNVSPPFSPIHVIYPYYPVSFRLGDVIQSYGEPSHIIAMSYYPSDSDEVYYDLRILYRPQGFILIDGGHRKPTLNAETDFGEVVFFAPNDDGLQAALQGAATYPEWLIPWEGLRDFGFYCRDEVGKPCP